MNWQAGEENMLVVSIGTGTSPDANAGLGADDMNLLYNASRIPSALMFASLNEQDLLCRIMGRCRAGGQIDREVGDMCDSNGPLQHKLFSYVRYNAELTQHGLQALGLGDIEPAHVQALDSVTYIDQLQRVGRAVAATELTPAHFTGFLDR
jgi:hypothetical protein